MAETRVGDRYRLERPLASGGMGAVWLAWDTLLERPVAVKRLHLQPGLPEAQRSLAVARVIREARITARLRHPNAVPVFDVVDDHEVPCLVMPYLPSRSLHDVVGSDGPLPPLRAAEVGAQVAAALTEAHRVGIVHRDVKPGNVLILDDGSAAITDFGISHAVGDATLTSTGMVTGTPAFLPPEVARGGPSDFAGDVYSLGSTLYFAVEGRPPFGSPDANPISVLHEVASAAPAPLTRAGPLTPAVQAMTAADPAARPTMAQVADRLAALPRATGNTEVITREQRRLVAPGAQPRQDTYRLRDGAAPAAAPTAALPRQAFPVAAPPRGNGPPAPPPPTPPRSHRGRRAMLVAAVLALLCIGVAIALVATRGTGRPSAGSGAEARHSSSPARPSRSPVPSSGGSSSGSHPRTRTRRAGIGAAGSGGTGSSGPTASAPTEPTHRTTGGPPTDAQLAGAVQAYFALVPDNLDAAWARLTRGFQQGRAGGRANFDAYWSSVDSVVASDVVGQAPHTAYATLTYHYSDGRDVTERTTFTVVRRGGVLKIAGES